MSVFPTPQAPKPDQEAAPQATHANTEEWVDLVNDSNEVIGQALRARVRRENLLHRGVAILCRNSRDEIYVHQRNFGKDLFPGYFDMLVGGVVAAGESYEAAARREVAEELGCEGAKVEYRFDCRYSGPLNNSLIQVYATTWDGPITHADGEIIWGGWIPVRQLDSWVRSVQVVPDGLEVYHAYQDWARQNRLPHLR